MSPQSGSGAKPQPLSVFVDIYGLTCALAAAFSDTQIRLKQESLAIAKTTARCAQYMGALKSFQSPHKRPRLLFPKFVKGLCSDGY